MAFSFSNTQNSTSNLQATYRGSLANKALVNSWIKKHWAKMVRRELDQTLMLRKFVMTVTFPDGKTGDRVTIPTIGRLGVNDKASGVPVTLQTPTTGTWAIDITRHKETSFMVEDIAEVMLDPNGLFAMNAAKEAAYAIARDIDSQILGLRAIFQNIAAQNVYSNGEAVASTNVASQPFTLNTFLRARLILDKAGVPQQDQVLVVTPEQYFQLLALDKMQSIDYSSSRAIESGVVGSIMGVPVYMNNLMSANSTTGFNNGSTTTATPGVSTSIYYPDHGGTPASLPVTWNTTANTTPATQAVHTAMLLHKDAYAVAMLQEPKTETSRETLYLSDAVVTSTIYGMREYRTTNAVNIHTNGVIPAT